MKFSLSVAGLYAVVLHATAPEPQRNTSPTTPFTPTLATCQEPPYTIDICDTQPSQPATLLGAKQCLKHLRHKGPDPDLIPLTGSRMERVAEYTSRDKSLEDVTTVVGVRAPNGMGGTVARTEVARMLQGAMERCRRAECQGGRCPVSVVSTDGGGSVEVWIWGEKRGVEWSPAGTGVGPSATVRGTEWYGDEDLDDRWIESIKEL